MIAGKNAGGHADTDSYHHPTRDTRSTKGVSKAAAPPGSVGKNFNANQYIKYLKRRDEKIEREEERARQKAEQAYQAEQNRKWAPVDRLDSAHQRRMQERALSGQQK